MAEAVLDAAAWRKALADGAALLRARSDAINALNVFPVPDGDTGTNMFLTMQEAARHVDQVSEDDVGAVARAAARGALLGARGNSGVILSQYLRGMATVLQQCRVATATDLAQALGSAAETAYSAVATPVEGTMLTVGRRAAERVDLATAGGPIAVLEAASLAAAEAVAHTPGQLPILRQAGVVDAGGEGLSTLLDGMLRSLRSEPIEDTTYARAPAVVDNLDLEHEHGFGYCTQLLVEGAGIDVTAVREGVTALGESAIVVGDEELIRIHVHSIRPGRVVDYLTDVGTLRDVHIENMDQQFRERRAQGREAPTRRRSGVVAVASGAGLRRVLASLGARVVDGGQTTNPSTEDILAAINLIAAEGVVVMPNNANVKMAAHQAVGLAERSARVLPTRNVVEGVAAMVAFNPEHDLEENFAAMGRAVAGVRSAEVTTAVRNAYVGAMEVRQGSLIGLIDDRVVMAGDGLRPVVLDLLGRLGAENAEIVTLYQGAELDALTLDDLVGAIRGRFPVPELEIVEGGQPLYPLFIAVE